MTTGEVQELGYHFAKGVFLYFSGIIVVGLLVLTLWSFARNLFGWGTDDSDINGRNRSGLRVHVDAKTGIEYLSDGHGGLVRREERK